MKVVGYVRVSTDDQKTSIQAQIEEITTFCKFKGYKLVDILVDEFVSGGLEIAKRPEGSKLMAMAENKEVDIIISGKVDRMFRDSVDGQITNRRLNELGVGMVLLSMGGNVVDTSTPEGELFFNILLTFAQFERKQIASRITKALQHKKKNNEVYSGKTPYGKTRVGKELIDCKEEIDVIHRIKILKENGNSYQAIADRLNEEGVRPKEKMKWHKSMIFELCQRDTSAKMN